MLALALVILTAPGASYGWWTTADPDVIRCYQDDRVLAGEYTLSTDTYRPWCGTLGRCVAVPNAKPPIVPPARNFGVTAREAGKEPHVSLAGNRATLSEVMNAVPGPLPDRAHLPWLVAVGGTAQQRKERLDRIPADLRAKFRESSKDANAWQVRPGYRAGEPVAWYALAPDGEELHRQTDDDVPGLVAALQKVAALRDPDKNYDPAKSPDLRKNWPLTGLPSVPPSVPIIGAALAALVAFTRPTRPDRPATESPP